MSSNVTEELVWWSQGGEVRVVESGIGVRVLGSGIGVSRVEKGLLSQGG